MAKQIDKSAPALHTPYAVFDMDGTLIDTNRGLTEAGEQYLASRGINPADHAAFFLSAVTMSDRELCTGLLRITGENKTVEQALDELEVEVRHVYERLQGTKPHAKDYLEKLKQAGVRMCVASATERGHIRYALEKLGLLDYFEFIVTTSDVGKSKDNPDIFLEVARRFGLTDCAQAAVYDDAPAAIRSAHGVGYRTVAVADDMNRSDPALFPSADLFIDTFADLL